MLRDNKPIPPEDAARLRRAAQDYIRDRKSKDRRYSQIKFATQLGQIKDNRNDTARAVSKTVLSQVLNGTYKGDSEPYLRRIDEFLSDQCLRRDRLETSYAQIGLAEQVFAVARHAKNNNSMGVIIMEPGDGKSTIARALLGYDSAAVMIRVSERCGDSLGVIDLLYRAMGIGGDSTFRTKRMAVEERMLRNRTMIILIDEAQKLKPTGLEMLRDLHDASDPDGEYPVSMVLFGDHDFYKLIVRARNGQSSPIKPQMTRRMYPIFDSLKQGRGGRGGDLYNTEDIIRILKNRQLRIASPAAINWITGLANVRGCKTESAA